MASKVAAQSLRNEALILYRRLLRAANEWEGPLEEKEYIRTETRELFQQNKDLTDPELIREKLFEGETRMELALH
jgi:hypothetical protein